MSYYAETQSATHILNDDNKKKSSLLKDRSWIRKPEEENEPVDRDPNFGKTVLSRYSYTETTESSEPDEVSSPKIRSPSTSVLALAKRFGGSQDELSTSGSYSSATLDSPRRYTTSTSNTTVLQEPKTSTTTKTISDNGQTTETTTITTSRYSSLKTTPKTDSFTERVRTSSREPAYSTYSPTQTTYSSIQTTYSPTETPKLTETYTGTKDAEDQLFETLHKSAKEDLPSSDSKTTVTTRTLYKSSDDGGDFKTTTSMRTASTDDFKTTTSTRTASTDDFKTTTSTRTASTAEDDLYGTLLPRSITSPSSSLRRDVVTVESSKGGESPSLTPTSSIRSYTRYSSYNDDIPSSPKSSYNISSQPSYEYSSLSSPTIHTSTTYNTRSSTRSEDSLRDPLYSKSSIKSVYTTPERTVLEKDLCTSCRKPFNADAKMVLDDMNIKCHAACFKCEVCSSTLGHLKAGDSMWVYKRMVHCENCFEVTRDKWRR
ncbi:sciellin isoform X3 [Genypterus blacodes]|uniref:sciellin isoform X3 n=1 Tax=Genypterus blacodes TaxID=154954 RepID=UPI003F757714